MIEENKEIEEKYEQKQTENERLKIEKEQLTAQLDTSPTIMDRIRSAVLLLRQSSESTSTTASANGSLTQRSQTEQTATPQTNGGTDTAEQGVPEAFKDQKPTNVIWKSEEELEEIRKGKGIENGRRDRNDSDDPNYASDHRELGGSSPR